MSKPSEFRELTKPETIREALEAMMPRGKFKLNDRKKPLVVTEVFDGKLKASVRKRTSVHTLVWEGYDRPRHMPNESQTNKVHSIEVHTYGEEPTQDNDITQDLDFLLLGKNVEVYDWGMTGAWVVGYIGGVKYDLEDEGYDVEVINNRALSVKR